MKSLYEIVRPVITEMSLDSDLQVPVSYIYDLYKPEIERLFDKGHLLEEWRNLVFSATCDAYVRNYLDKLITRGHLRLDRLDENFHARWMRNNLFTSTQWRQGVGLYEEALFEEFLRTDYLADADDAKREQARLFCVWLAYTVHLVLQLEDTTHTFDQSDIDLFTDWVSYTKAILTWQENLQADTA